MADFWLEASIEFTCFLHLKGDSDAHFASLFSTSRVHKTWRLLGPLNRKQSSRLRFGVNWLRLLSWSNWELQVGWRTLSTLSMHICMYLYLPISSHLPYLSLIRLSLHFLMLELSAVWHPQVLKMNECRGAFQFPQYFLTDLSLYGCFSGAHDFTSFRAIGLPRAVIFVILVARGCDASRQK